jgi:hypothetical protein
MCNALWLSQYRVGVLARGTPGSARRYNNHYNSHVADDKALYSASEEDLDTVACFFARHEIKEFSIKKQYPDMDLLVSMQPAQSASE